MGKTNIEWADMVWNPVDGCTKVSTGCLNCYAAVMAKRLAGMNRYGWMNGRTFDQVKEHPERLEDPLFWKKPRRIFVDSMGDLFHEKVSDEGIRRVFGIMEECSHRTQPDDLVADVPVRSAAGSRELSASRSSAHAEDLESSRVHQFLILTKRPERMAKMSLSMSIPDNVWLGTSIEDQTSADERLAWLMEIDHPNLFVSAEPLLGKITLPRKYHLSTWLKWLIIGGESGAHARPCDPEWVRELIYQVKGIDTKDISAPSRSATGSRELGVSSDCAHAQSEEVTGIPVYFKQWGMWIHRSQMQWAKVPFTAKDFPEDYEFLRTTKEKAGHVIDGEVFEEYPVGLMMTAPARADGSACSSQPEAEMSQHLRTGLDGPALRKAGK